ncbi:MAG: 50S ribosomal protein L10 [archaeon]|nr:50S ribosomal protein L10 [archaeon]
MAHVADWKKGIVKSLINEMVAKPVVAVVNMYGIGGQQIQSMRAGLRQHATLKMTKNNLMLLAFDEAAKQKPGLNILKDKISGQCAIIATDLNPFNLFRQLEATKTASPAKAGELAPEDIIVHQGPTPFGPGPIIGELQKLGLPTSIDGGKIVVRKDTTLVEKGNPIPANVAAMLPKLGIFPMIVGLDLRAAYENKVVYERDVLDISEDYYKSLFANAVTNAHALSIAIVFPTTETIMSLVKKAFREALGISIATVFPNKYNVKVLLSKADAQMLSVALAANYSNNAIVAKVKPVVATPVTEESKEEVKNVEKDKEVSEEEAVSGLSELFG